MRAKISEVSMTTRVMVITLVLVSAWAIAAGAIAIGGTGTANSAQITGTDPGQSLAPVTVASSAPAVLEAPELRRRPRGRRDADRDFGHVEQ